jgi:hypothetical protein
MHGELLAEHGHTVLQEEGSRFAGDQQFLFVGLDGVHPGVSAVLSNRSIQVAHRPLVHCTHVGSGQQTSTHHLHARDPAVHIGVLCGV